MGHSTKKKPFRLTFSHFIRWFIFATVAVSSVNYLSSAHRPNTDSNVLGDTTQDLSVTLDQFSTYLSPQQKAQIDKITQNPLLNQIAKSAIDASGDWPAFIDTQIVEIKKRFVTTIYLDIIKAIDKSKKH